MKRALKRKPTASGREVFSFNSNEDGLAKNLLQLAAFSGNRLRRSPTDPDHGSYLCNGDLSLVRNS